MKLAGLGLLTTIFVDWRETFPEELVVEVATAVELDTLRKINVGLVVSNFESLGCELHEVVEIVDVGHVVLTIMIAHQVLSNDWLKTIKWIWQWFLRNLLELFAALSFEDIHIGSGCCIHHYTRPRKRGIKVVFVDRHTLALNRERTDVAHAHRWLWSSRSDHHMSRREIITQTKVRSNRGDLVFGCTTLH